MTKKKWDETSSTLELVRNVCNWLITLFIVYHLAYYYFFDIKEMSPIYYEGFAFVAAIYVASITFNWIGEYLWGWQVDEEDRSE